MTEIDMRQQIESVVRACQSQVDASYRREMRVRAALREMRSRVARIELALTRPFKACHLERSRAKLEVWRSAVRMLEKCVAE